MFDTALKVNLKLLTSYNLSFDKKEYITNQSILVALEMDYQTEDTYNYVVDTFEQLLEKFDLSKHRNELLYLVMKKNEQIRIRYDAYWQNYHDDLTSKEVASFMLAYKESKPNEHLQLAVKPTLNATASIKDTAIAKWMCQVLFEKIEAREFPLGIFGEKILYNLFGNDFSSDTPLDLNKLKATATMGIRKPTKQLNKLKVEFSQFLQVYLHENTELKLPDGIMLTDAQANFFFDVLEMLGYHDREDFDSEPKDYMHAIFRNTLTSK
ncbi:hypothetical protein ACS5PU_20585 [Pedobacter sp. GSP4]|uniref:hypothetical protein n=1 Tax=Pedobacter sp. GSP4 TaxID=3453716 RepID=UPI003EEB166D